MANSSPPNSTGIHPLLASRWSPRAYADTRVDHDNVLLLLEAARWAPSAFNSQPWRFIVLERLEDPAAFALGFAALVPFNQSWNFNAQVLIAVLADMLMPNGASNAAASFDAGAATMSLLLQAHAQGLAAHAMSGFDADALRQAFGFPERYAVLSMISIAHHGDVSALPAALAEREGAPRVRRHLSEIVHFGRWTSPTPASA